MDIALLLPIMIVILIVMMFLQSSKQRKAMKAVQEMQDSLAVGDRVLTTSGLQASISSINEDTIGLEIAPGVHTQWDRRVIREKIDSTTSTANESGAESSGSL